MIKDYTIQEVKTRMDTYEILEDLGVKIKRDMACCPFHNEKSPSFHIWKSSNRYKCFGCGKSGDGINAVMELKRLTFPEAIEWVAAKYNIMVEYDQQTVEETKEKKHAVDEQFVILEWAHDKFESMLHSLPEESDAWQYLIKRGYTPEICRQFSIGYAPDGFDFLKGGLLNMGKLQPAVDLGLVISKEGKNYDAFRNRIMIPIHNTNGRLCGFGGRTIGNSEVKYINSKESLIYQKKNIWFLLDRAIKAIKEAGFAYVQEGYMDAMSWHIADIVNTVAGCGTQITIEQVRLLKRYTDSVVITMDGDKAGTKKTLELVDTFLKEEFKVEVIHFEENRDPDEYKNHYFKNPIFISDEEASIEVA